ncbi:GTP-binding protein [Elusimicrobiota bacterium]
MKTIKFVIAGHIDHGKSTLIGRLLFDTDSLSQEQLDEINKAAGGPDENHALAHLLDSLEEERKQGITIDTARVSFCAREKLFVIIDVPGHAEFIKNMASGASCADAAALIVDANEGVREQTKRHAYLLSMLGINQVIVVVSKMDSAGFDKSRFETVSRDALTLLERVGIRSRLSVPVSALCGDNIGKGSQSMPWYQGHNLLDALESTQAKGHSGKGPLMLPIQDCYEVAGERIAAGRVESGVISNRQTVKIMPMGQIVKIADIKKYLGSALSAIKGECIGITLKSAIPLSRGDIICDKEGKLAYKRSFLARIFWFSKEHLCRGGGLMIKCATQESACEVVNIPKKLDSSGFNAVEEDAQYLADGESGIVHLLTKRPVALAAFRDSPELGRFVLSKNGVVCAGGVVDLAGHG